MGLGIASILLYNMPYSFTGLQELGLAFFVVNVMLFFFLLALTITRYVLWPRLLPIMLYHPTQAFFLGTFTMGAVTLDEIIILGLIPRLGQAWLYVGWYFWWMIAAATIVVAIGVPWITQTRQEQQFRQITAVWFLPIVAPVVCASAGSIVANAMVDAGLLAAGQGNPAAAASWYSHARVQEIACYLLLGIGLIPSLLWMPIYSTRLAIHKLPTAVIVSSFIPLGCCGQGALAVLHISRTLRRITVITGVPPLGGVDDSVGNVISPASAQAMADAIYAVSQVGALFLWGLGIVWMSLAVMSIADVLSVSDIALNLGLWASTFPVGTMAASAALFGAEFGSTAFKVALSLELGSYGLLSQGLWNGCYEALLPLLSIVLNVAALSAASYTPTPRNLCQLFEHAGLINLDALGCARVLSPGKRFHSLVGKDKACSALNAAGLVNLDTLGCEMKNEHEIEERGLAWHHPPTLPPPKEEDSEPSTPCPSPPTVPAQPPKTPAQPPKALTEPPKNPAQPPAQPQHKDPTPPENPPATSDCGKPCSTKELCQVIQTGMINVDILGCAKIGEGAHFGGGVGGGAHADDGWLKEEKDEEAKGKITARCTGGEGCPSSANKCDKEQKCKVKACKIMQHAGLINLDLLGCAHIL
ncbi:Plasma membrane sulfite pump involved in sulfite metabolism [Tilletia horrida]|uniref:Plasma membrane sulfite pump involved in sulfite metabolism n=1 Tax=Tilletia horrida TaxID=155126 RepID=A0AAN6G8A2_9BASI|nr:Plasma membrane sulfite pump involved in sulfite metabolism [Tilletia horrida]